MFDRNYFKKTVKEWVKQNPEATLDDLIDFCEDQIPAAEYSANSWLIDQTINWYKHILSTRESYSQDEEYSLEEENLKFAN